MVCVWPTCDKGYTVFFRLHIPIREDWFCLRIYYPFKVVLIFKEIFKLIHRVVGFITVYMHIYHYLLLFITHPPPFTCSLSTSGWSWPPLPTSPLLRIHFTSVLLPALSPSTALPASFSPIVLLLISFEERWNLSSEYETKCDHFLSEFWLSLLHAIFSSTPFRWGIISTLSTLLYKITLHLCTILSPSVCLLMDI